MEQPGESRLESFLLDSAERGRRPLPGWRRAALVLLVALLLLGAWWSFEPDRPQPREFPSVRGHSVVPAGLVLTATLEATLQTLLDKPGGYIANDVMPPGVWLDNMAAFERGALAASRDLVRAMRRDFSHAPGVALEDADLLRAEPRFFFDADDWFATETEFRAGLLALSLYRQRLEAAPPAAVFIARPDTLARWLADVDARLAGYVQALAGAAREDDGRTPWSEADDVFYEARGYAWALRAQQDAAAIEFVRVLEVAGTGAQQQQVMRELDGALRPVRSPFILSGSEYGLLANHSLVLAGYLSRARNGVLQMQAVLAGR